MFWTLLVLGLGGWLLWRLFGPPKPDTDVSPVEEIFREHEAKRTENVPPVRTEPVPFSRIPLLKGEMFTPLDKKFDAADAAKAVELFFREIGRGDDHEMLDGEVDAFRSALAEHEHNLEWRARDAESEINQQEFDEDCAESGAWDDEAPPEERADARRNAKELRARRLRLEGTAKTAEHALKALQADHRDFMVAYLNHRIHGRKTPVARY